LLYTTPDATICQSDAEVAPPYAVEVKTSVVLVKVDMLPAMNMVGSAVENTRTVCPGVNAVLDALTFTVNVLDPMPGVFVVVLVSAV